MEWPKLKNIIILILLLVNLFLLILVGAQERTSAQYEAQTFSNAVSILGENGIRLKEENVSAQMKLSTMSVERSQAGEGSLAAALLGECTASDLGSGRYIYQSALGWAEFRSNGNFNFNFHDNALTTDVGTEQEHALDTLEKIGFTGSLVSRTEDGETVTLEVCQLWENAQVFSCRVTLEYQNGALSGITGQRLMGTPQPTASESTPLSVPTALLRILSGITDMGDVCSEITGMMPGYLLSPSTDAAQLIPVWHVTTDAGAYYLNALTGVLERA